MATRYRGEPTRPRLGEVSTAGSDSSPRRQPEPSRRRAVRGDRRRDQDAWRERLGRVRAGSALALLIDALPGAPVVTVQSAASLIGRSEQAVNEAIPRLVDAGILRQTTVGRRNRAFEATELIDAFTDLERRLASPAGDTKSSAPARAVPRRRRPQ